MNEDLEAIRTSLESAYNLTPDPNNQSTQEITSEIKQWLGELEEKLRDNQADDHQTKLILENLKSKGEALDERYRKLKAQRFEWLRGLIDD